jgi:hypothetical protein
MCFDQSLQSISSISPKMVGFPLEQCRWQMKVRAACCRGPQWPLHVALELQLNRQMFGLGFASSFSIASVFFH